MRNIIWKELGSKVLDNCSLISCFSMENYCYKGSIFIQVGLQSGSGFDNSNLPCFKLFSNSGVIFDKKMTAGLFSACEYIYKLSVPPLIWWPKNKSVISVSRHQVSNREVSLGCINVVGIKDYSLARNIVKELRVLLKSGVIRKSDSANIFFSDAGFYSAISSRKIRRLLPNAKIVFNVQDVPGFEIVSKSRIKRLLKKFLYCRFKQFCARYVDGYVFLSKFMEEVLPIDRKKSIVIPGLCSVAPFSMKFNPHQICYAGVIDDKYLSTDLLIKSFRIAKSVYPDAKLVVCGPGKSDLLFKSLEVGSIEYLGNLSPEDALAVQQDSGVLINLRKNTKEFRYSFPSKLTNYLSLGRPIIQSNLDSIPNYIKDALIIVDDLTVEKVAAAMVKCMALSKPERIEIASKEFSICKQLSPTNVAKEVLNLFEEIRKS